MDDISQKSDVVTLRLTRDILNESIISSDFNQRQQTI